MQIQERRSADRFSLESQGCAIVRGNILDMKTRDVSLGGALVEFVTQSALRKGTEFRLRLNVGFVGKATVCWTNTSDNRTLYGIKFERFDLYSDLALNAYFVKHEHQLSWQPLKPNSPQNLQHS